MSERGNRVRRHDGSVVDLERIKAETVAYFKALDEAAPAAPLPPR